MIRTAKVDLAKVDVKKLEGLLDKQCQTQLVAIGDIVPNPDNVNKMGAQFFAALKAQLADPEIGFTAPIICRKNPDPQSHAKFMIIDGEHRWRAAREVGYSKVPVFEMDATDAKAMFLMLAQNRIHGQTSEDDMVKLTQRIQRDFAEDPFLSGEGQRDLFARMVLEEDPIGDKSKYEVSDEDLDQKQEITQPVTLYLLPDQIDLWRQITGQIRLSEGCTLESAAMMVMQHFVDTTGFGGKTGDDQLDRKQSDLVGDEAPPPPEDADEVPQAGARGKKGGRKSRVESLA